MSMLRLAGSVYDWRRCPASQYAKQWRTRGSEKIPRGVRRVGNSDVHRPVVTPVISKLSAQICCGLAKAYLTFKGSCTSCKAVFQTTLRPGRFYCMCDWGLSFASMKSRNLEEVIPFIEFT